MSDAPPPPPAAPAVRFRVVSGSDVVKRSQSPQTASSSSVPQQQLQQQHQPPRIRYIRPGLVYARPPPGYHLQRGELPFSHSTQAVQPRRIIPTIIRQPGVTRIIRPINPQHTGNLDNKKKLITILKSFLTRCSTTQDANMPQMIITTEQYLKGVISTADYLQVLHQNVKGVRETLSSFLDLYINAVRKDIQEKRIAMEEIVPYKLVTTETYQYPPQQQQQQAAIYSTPSPSFETTVSGEQMNIKLEPMPVSSQQQQQQVSSPMIQGSNNSASYQVAKMEPGSARSSPILRTSSPYLVNKSHGSVGMIEHQQQRASPLTITREPIQQQQIKTSPMAATIAPSMDMATTAVYEQKQFQEPMKTDMPQQDNSTFITPDSPFQLPPQHQQQPQQSLPQFDPPPQPSPPQPQTLNFDGDTPLTELPHDLALQRSLIDPETFSALMQRKVPGITIESPAFLMISEFLETKIRKIIATAREAAEHRSEQFRINPNYVEAENPKAQLNAIEKMEKLEIQRKIDKENERLLKNVKNDSNKAKELMKSKEDENLNRDANEAAMSAIGGKKRTWQNRKLDGNDSGGPGAKKAAKIRGKQISMKDLLFAFEKDSFAKDSIVYRKILYGLYNDGKN